MKYFLSCDWGTSSFRLRLIETTTKVVLVETLSEQGIAATYELWKQQQEQERFSFYSSFILEQLALLEKQYGKLPGTTPLIISGMAASAIGMYELPYKSLPLTSIHSELITHIIEATEFFPYRIVLVSGLDTSNDVMRGEETILAGCELINTTEEQLYIFPGTHSKHVIVQNGTIKNFKTYMTGEVFQLLSSKSLLASSVEKDTNGNDYTGLFHKGVRDATEGSFLNNIFHVRTNTLLRKLNKKENYMYLSGLVIGEELKNISTENYHTINLVSSGSLMELYKIVIAVIGLQNKLSLIDADKALIKGQLKILKYIQ